MQSIRCNWSEADRSGTDGCDKRKLRISFARGTGIGVTGSVDHEEAGKAATDRQRVFRVLCHGWAFRALYLPDGRCYVRSFLLAGDIIGCEFETWPRNAAQVIAVTDVECLQCDREFKGLSKDEREGMLRRIADAPARELALLNGIALRLSKLSPYERIIHFLLETLERARAAGLTEGNRFWFLVAQEVLADCLGLSKVHLNRNLQALRNDGVIRYEASMMELIDVPALVRRVNYESLYGSNELLDRMHQEQDKQGRQRSQERDSESSSGIQLDDERSVQALYFAERERRQMIRGQLSAPISVVTFASFGYVTLGSDIGFSGSSLISYTIFLLWLLSYLLVLTASILVAMVELQYMRLDLSDFEDHGPLDTQIGYFRETYFALRDANRKAERLRGYALLILMIAVTIFLAALLMLPLHGSG